ncbi:hypothetical protein WICPIJ_003727 [Wickerhamomyces pijperi]|uniref:Uncharacterized protein n=1 Tax=Wickerhamomyces pijperi TaxID=599730 RepID=A0A9P8Q9C2_WICPI|nr:hypothetical protein WICPIJ_003727 [Wickerhamomyces pijperi]
MESHFSGSGRSPVTGIVVEIPIAIKALVDSFFSFFSFFSFGAFSFFSFTGGGGGVGCDETDDGFVLAGEASDILSVLGLVDFSGVDSLMCDGETASSS